MWSKYGIPWVTRARGRDCGVSLERVTHTHVVQYGMLWVTGGLMYSIGRGCNGISYTFLQWGYSKGITLAGGGMQNSFCRFRKISLWFCNQAFLQYGCKRAFTLFWGCMLGSSCRFGKILLGFGDHASLSIWGKMGINNRTPSAELSKPWWSS